MLPRTCLDGNGRRRGAKPLTLALATLLACAWGDAGPAEPAAPAAADRALTPAASLSARASACDGTARRVLEVGPGQAYVVPSAAAAVAQTGDVIRIAAGDYHGDVATWRAAGLTLCGVGGRARLFADGKHAQGKAIWVVVGADTVIEGVEFHGAKVPDHNGAGIRAEGGNLTIRDCGFYDSEEGVLGGSGVVRIDRSEFARNGHGDGQSHNLYIGSATRLIVTASFFHGAKIGHNLKSRAKETIIENSYFMDGPGGTSSYLADFPNGGIVTLRGNLFHKGPRADNPAAIAYGQEGLKWPGNTLEMVHNTLVSTYSGGTFIAAHAGTQRITLIANLFAGTHNPQVLGGAVASGAITRRDNVAAAAADLPGASNVTAPNFWPDVALRSRLALRAAPDAAYVSDSPRPFALRPLRQTPRLAGALQSSP
jgi:hypothetical protein